MNAVAKMRQAGFELAITKRGGLWVEPASRLTDEQRAYIRAHKVLLLEELRAETTPPPPVDSAIAPPVTKAGIVCCADCAHSVLPPDTCPLYGWRLCGLDIEGGGGFGRTQRRCEAWETAA